VPQAHFQVGRVDKSKSVAINLIKRRNMLWMSEREKLEVPFLDALASLETMFKIK